MRISKLSPSARAQGRWLCQLEDGTILRLGECEVLDFGLYAGRALTEREVEAIQAAAGKNARREKALAYAGSRATSRRDMARKLEQWGADQAEQEAVCDRLEELGVLDDGSYAALVARSYASRGYGEKKLRDELYRRGVPREHWDAALEGAGDPAEAIDAFLTKKLRGADLSDPKVYQRASDALARRGFRWEDISAGLRRYGAELEEE